MNRLATWVRTLLPTPPVKRVNDAVLGPLDWDQLHEAWMSRPMASLNRYNIQIDRYKRLPTPPEDCLRVAHDIARDPDRLEWLVGCVLRADADRRPESLREGIRQMRMTRIMLKKDAGAVVGWISLDGYLPLHNWAVWHHNGVPGGLDQSAS